ncbi:MAG: acyl-CoA/acyl-ACP dehydrogenase [Corynebacteriales bacterium]|uniref:Acyl-CoA/acyl-ACP dehydrogenase n=1 Tax=Williamsia herbipolensis TaxID=1603258 RepID=A0AAU4K7L3_9NOCA|nr:acyl-CoA dehydrogenase family protein [Williamsia herbipolensis]MCX6469821.1 acyl-CoA/acyl-ACP dehydrogenase [Mycobacteriales bacterium]
MLSTLDAARDVVDSVLAPAAGEVDASGKIPVGHFEALARAGLFGAALGDDRAHLAEIAETVISGCLATGFVWAQHHGVALAVARSPRGDLLPALRSGEVIAGVSYAGMASHGQTLRARRTDTGYVLSGSSAFVTGWGVIDMIGAWAHEESTGEVHLFAIGRPELSAGLTATPLDLVAAQASNTVSLDWDDVEVAADRLVTTMPADRRPQGANMTIRLNAALALGICRSALRELDAVAARNFEFADAAAAARAEVARVRTDLDASIDDGAALYRHRAAANDLAMRLATSVAAAAGSRSVLTGSTPARLVREALFCAVCASRPAIRDEMLVRLLPEGRAT